MSWKLGARRAVGMTASYNNSHGYSSMEFRNFRSEFPVRGPQHVCKRFR